MMRLPLQGPLLALATSSLFQLPAAKAELHPRRHSAVHRGVPIPLTEGDKAAGLIERPSSAACLAQWEDCTGDWENCCDGFRCAQIDAAGSGRCLDLQETCSEQCGEAPPPNGDDYSDRIRVNQVGYLRLATKVGVIVHNSTDPLGWRVQDAADESFVLGGNTTVYGDDGASGDHLHHADFSSLSDLGTYKLVVDGIGSSLEFQIAPSLYPDLPHEAMNYFYFHRLGMEIKGEYLIDDRYAREALHPGDTDVPAYPGWCGDCDDFDLWGSWADAGDFGIYTVNHAISAWTLLNLLEMFPSAFGDGELNLPESGNAFPDVLDEVDFGSRFVRGMLPSDGGLASHKAHNHEWSAFTITIEGENQANAAGTRSAMGSSTPATYAVARVNAQLARVWHTKGGDADYVATLWSAAEDAWSRAEGTSKMYNAAEASPGPAVGGGDYPDSQMDDDRYAAACEMYLTAYALGYSDVGRYRAAVRTKYKYFTAMSEWDWKTVASAGTLSLYAAENDLSGSDKGWIEMNIVSFANQIKLAIDTEGYPSNLNYGSEFAQYPWGSNSFIMNRMIALAYAYEITGTISYQKYMLRSMDYIMGTNAMDISYITGYGEKSETDTHDRWAWTIGQDAFWPKGWLSGGPNNELINDYETPGGVAAAKSYAGRGTAPYAWGSKENTVNWNAPLAWTAWYIENKIVPNLGGCGGDCPLVAPVAHPLSANLQMDTFVNLVLSASDDDGNVTTWEIVDLPAFGTLSGDAPSLLYEPNTGAVGTGTFTFTAPNLVYTPNAGAIGTDTFTFRAIDDSGVVSNIASVTLIIQDCNYKDIFQVPSDFPAYFGVYNYVHVSEGGPSLEKLSKPAHSVHWLNPGFYQFSLLWDGEPYYLDLIGCMTDKTLEGSAASFTLSGCGVAGLDGEYWITQQDGDEIWVEKNNGWVIVFTNRPTEASEAKEDHGRPEFCRSSEVTGLGGQVQGEPTPSNLTESPTFEPTNQSSNRTNLTESPTNEPTGQLTNRTNVTESPTNEPTGQPTNRTNLTESPTNEPTGQPTNRTNVTESPTNEPTGQPSKSPVPTMVKYICHQNAREDADICANGEEALGSGCLVQGASCGKGEKVCWLATCG